MKNLIHIIALAILFNKCMFLQQAESKLETTKDIYIKENNVVVFAKPFIYPFENIMALEPIIKYDITYSSLFVEGFSEDNKRISGIRRLLKDIKTLWIYHKGEEVGTFEVKGFIDLSEYGGPKVALDGSFKWIVNLPKDTLAFFDGCLALSKKIPQPFFLNIGVLNKNQLNKLDKILDKNLAKNIKLYDDKIKELKIKSLERLRKIGKQPVFKYVNVIDFNTDGIPEVIGDIKWKSNPCEYMETQVFASWVKNDWQILKSSSQISDCQKFEAAGDANFSITPIDIDGDGIAELFIEENIWENNTQTLYKIEGNTWKEILTINFGS